MATLDGHNNAGIGGSSSGAITLTTSLTNDIIVVFALSTQAASPHRTVSSISDTAGLTWAKRSSVSQDNVAGQFSTVWESLEEWWAYSAGALAGDTITVTFSGSVDDGVLIAFGVHSSGTQFSGASFDANASLPATQAFSTGTTPSISGISTTSANTFLFAVSGANQIYGGSPATGYTEIDFTTSFGSPLAGMSAQFQAFGSAQTNITVDGGEGATAPLFIVDAIAEPSAGAALVTGWQNYSEDPPRRRRIIDQPQALTLTPATLPVPISGMAWYAQPEPVPKKRRPIDDPAWAPQPITQAVTAPPNGWFAAEDPRPARRVRIDDALAWAIAPPAKPPTGWFPQSDDPPPRRVRRAPEDSAFVPLPFPALTVAWIAQSAEPSVRRRAPRDEAPAWVPQVFSVVSTISGMGWYSPQDDLPVRRRPADQSLQMSWIGPMSAPVPATATFVMWPYAPPQLSLSLP